MANITNDKEITTVSTRSAEIATMDISAFMPDAARARIEEVVEVPAPPSFKNADGTRATLRIRKLPYEDIQRIVNEYQSKRVLRDRRGRPETSGTGRAAVIEDSNSTKMTCAMILEALEFPDLKSGDFTKAYNCPDPIDVVLKVFNTSEDFTYVIQAVNDVNGLSREGGESYEKEMVDHAKN